MSRYKDQMIGVMEDFYSYLNVDGMTNEQAIVKIKQTMASIGKNMFVMRSNVRSKNMGEYECCDCLQTFWCDEPPEGREVCDECKEEERKERQRRE